MRNPDWRNGKDDRSKASQYVAMGLSLGLLVGVILDNLALGLVLGVVFGSMLNRKRGKKQ